MVDLVTLHEGAPSRPDYLLHFPLPVITLFITPFCSLLDYLSIFFYSLLKSSRSLYSFSR